MIGQLALGREDDLDWWVSAIAGRNTYADSLFMDCCRAFLIRELLDEEDVSEIVVPSSSLAEVTRKLCQKKNLNVRILSAEGPLRILCDFLAALSAYGQDMIKYSYRLWLCRATYPPDKQDMPADCTLIDIFVLDRSFVDGDYQDRYYDDFGGYVREEEAESFVYIPTLDVRFSNTGRVLQALRKSRRRFLLAEDVLKARDYLYAWAYPCRAVRLCPPQTMIEDIDVTPLVRRAWQRHLFSGNSVEALLKFRFARRLKERGVSIRLIIDWFENQVIDKGANAGFRKYYPDTPIIGYQGFEAPPYYLCAYPTSAEYRSRVLPLSVAVCGRSWVAERKRYCPEVDVMIAPAFRYSRVWRERSVTQAAADFQVLIVLPLDVENAVDLLKSIIELAGRPEMERLSFLLKPHPALSMDSLLARSCFSLPSSLTVVKGDFFEYLEQASVIIGNASSTLLEAVACGIPVIVAGSLTGVSHNPIPEAVPQDIWRLCYTAEEMAEALEHFRSMTDADRKRLVAIGRDVRAGYFEPATREAVCSFLRLSGDQDTAKDKIHERRI